MKNKLRLFTISSASLLALTQYAGIAVAQDDEPAADTRRLEQVTVTARRVEEDLQSTPVTVSAFTERALETRGITDTVELAQFVPNVTFDTTSTFSGAASTFQGFIRGIGQSDFAINTDPGVGVYVDDVYIARTVGSVFDLFDISQVEVLKGPQGTLFGRNTIGGAVNITTQRPDDSAFTARGSVEFGRFDRIGIDGALNIPIAEGIAATVAFSSEQQDGFQDRVIPNDPGDLANPGGFLGAFNFLPPGTLPIDPDFTGGLIQNVVPVDVTTATNQNGQDPGGLDNQAIRAKLLWEINDRLETTTSFDYSRARDAAPAQSVVAFIGSQEAAPIAGLPGGTGPTGGIGPDGLNPASLAAAFNGCLLAGNLPPAAAPPFCATAATFGFDPTALNSDGDPSNDIPFFDTNIVSDDIDTTFGTGPNFSNFDSYGFSNVTSFDVTDNVELKSIVAYRELSAAFGTDLDGSPLPLNSPTFTIDQDQFSYEAQINGNYEVAGRALDFTVGGFYFTEDAVQVDSLSIGTFLQIGGQNAQDTRAFAFFGEANYEVLPGLTALFGVRYTDERKELQLDQQNLTDFFGVVFSDAFVQATTGGIPGVAGSGGVDPGDNGETNNTPFIEDVNGNTPFPRLNADGSISLNFLGPEEEQVANFDDVSFRAGLNYKVTEDVFTYFTFSQGFKSGGFTTRLTAPFNPAFNPPAALIEAGAGNVPPGLAGIVFDPETSDNYEVGIKADLFGGTVRANAAAFWNNYDDIQIVVTRGISPANENAGDGRIRGVELELEAYPTEQLSLVGSFGYTDAEYTNIDPLAFPVTEDSEFQNTPEFSAAAAANYVQPVFNNNGELTFNLNYSYKSSVENDAQNTPELSQDSTHLLGGHIKYAPTNADWAVSLIGRNITNERFIGGGFNAGTGVSVVSATFNRPAEWRIKFDYQF